jgi:hypothetical protein
MKSVVMSLSDLLTGEPLMIDRYEEMSSWVTYTGRSHLLVRKGGQTWLHRSCLSVWVDSSCDVHDFTVTSYKQNTELQKIPRQKGPYPAALTKFYIALVSTFRIPNYNHAPHNDVSVNDGPHIRRWSHKIVILYYNITTPTIVLQLPTVFSTVTCCTGL